MKRLSDGKEFYSEHKLNIITDASLTPLKILLQLVVLPNTGF